jgi:hypothetical protein
VVFVPYPCNDQFQYVGVFVEVSLNVTTNGADPDVVLAVKEAIGATDVRYLMITIPEPPFPPVADEYLSAPPPPPPVLAVPLNGTVVLEPPRPPPYVPLPGVAV